MNDWVNWIFIKGARKGKTMECKEKGLIGTEYECWGEKENQFG